MNGYAGVNFMLVEDVTRTMSGKHLFLATTWDEMVGNVKSFYAFYAFYAFLRDDL